MTKYSPVQPRRYQVFGVQYAGYSFPTLAEAAAEMQRVSAFVSVPYVMRIEHCYVGRCATGTASTMVLSSDGAL